MPSPAISRLCGFTSRWTICWPCTYSSASAAWRATFSTSDGGSPGAPALAEDAAQVGALDQLHDQPVAAVIAAVVDHVHHPRVAQAAQQAGLDVEPGAWPGLVSSLSATSRPSARARKTAPMAPDEIGATIS